MAVSSPVVPLPSLSRMPWVFTPEETASVLGMSRDAVYDALARKELPGIKIGGAWKVPAAELARMFGIREAEQLVSARDELRRAQHDVRGVVAMTDLEPLFATQLLEAVKRISGVITALTVQDDDETQRRS